MIRRFLVILVLLALFAQFVPGGLFQPTATVAEEPSSSSKISHLLALQVQAKLQVAMNGGLSPASEGSNQTFDLWQWPGLRLEDLTSQRIFVHFNQPPTQSQVVELAADNLTLHLGSWIPPVGNHPTGFLLADMPVDKLAAVAAKPYVARLETAERVLEPQNDLGTQKMNAPAAWATGYNGTGVRIAVLDSGLDLTHPDIPTPVAKKDFSNYPTSLDDNIANTVTGHGTHVTGSVLGRGTQSGGVYRGSAPAADLIFLKIGTDETGGAPTPAMVGAIKAATDNYSADIITMSYGGWDMYHDGTSEEAQAVDYAVSRGVVTLIAAGNDAAANKHYSGTVAASSSTAFIPISVAGAGNLDTTLWFDLVYYDGLGTSKNLSLQFYAPSQASIPTFNYSQGESPRGTESRGGFIGDEFGPYAVPAGSSAPFVKVINSSASAQFFHLYVFISGAGSVTFPNADPYYTIFSPADADGAIAVGAYTTRKVWFDYANNGWQATSETVDQISTFSNRGPRVDTGAPPKPNVVAPGAMIISTRDNVVYPWANRGPYYIDNDGPNENNATKNNGAGPADYYVMKGTSMATPLAAGVAALILQKNPTWTPAQVKNALESKATDKGAAGHDNDYGWGLVNALAAVDTSSITITVSSRQAWTDTGLSVSSGDVIHVTASGSVKWDSSGTRTGPDGTDNPSGSSNFLVTNPAVPPQSLVGNIADSSTLDGKGFFVGSSFQGTVPIPNTTKESGKLFLGFNDGFVLGDRSGLDSGAVGDNDGSFTATITITKAPAVTTDNATNVTTNSTTLNGTLESLGTAPSANVSFEWGTTSGNLIQPTTPQQMTTTGNFSAIISSLSANTTYYFRAKAVADNITVYGAEKSFVTTSAPSAVAPIISISPSGGPPGTTVTVVGSNFTASETGITVTYDGTAVVSGISANAQGGWSANFVVPASASGFHIVDAYGSLTPATAVPDRTFSVIPSLSTSRTSGAPGSSVTVTGSGFGAGETGITVTYDGTAVVSGISANAQGGWSANFVVPASASGSHTIDASGAATLATTVSDVTFTITPGISINRASGAPGTSVTVTGSGFGAGETGITVTYDGTAVVSGISANAQGGWSANFVVPASASGSHTIDASGSVTPATAVPDVIFTTLPKPVASIAVTPAAPVIPLGLDIQFRATATYADNSSEDVTTLVAWSSGNTSVATISAAGLATAKAAGTTVITATSGAISGNTTLTVTTVTTVEVNLGNTIILSPGQNITASSSAGIPVDVRNISTNASGLAAFDFTLNWNPAVIQVDRVRTSLAASDQGWALTVGAINNTTGTVSFVGTTTQTPYSKADITLAYLGISAVGSAGNTTTITITVKDLIDNALQQITPRSAVNAPVAVTSLMAETSLAQARDTDGVVVAKVNIDRIKDPSTGLSANITGGIGSYTATVSSNASSSIQFLGVRGESPFDNPTVDVSTGFFGVDNVTSPIQASNTTVAKVVAILTGNTTTILTLTVVFQSIRAAGDPAVNVPEESSNTITFLRGDTDMSGRVTITDSLALKQYLVGQLALSQINPINAATTSHDGAGGDKITVADALAIEQYLVNQLNAYFQ